MRDQKVIHQAFASHPVVTILGPKECGKTTLARQYVETIKAREPVHFFDLNDFTDITTLENPKTVFSSLKGLIILDEIQHLPNLFSLIRVLVDQPNCQQRFLILGSASRELIRQSSETLAGRIAYIELTPFALCEVDHLETLWLRGGFPNSYLAKNLEESLFWRKQYVTTFLERDIPNLGIRIPPVALRRFWIMLAHYHGQTFNSSEMGSSLGIADTTVRRYLDILTGTFMVRQLIPWLANIKKRQVKTQKIYFRDSGLFHTLSNITDRNSLLHHPKLGASWEGFALEETIRTYQAESEECFYWGIHSQAELDLLIIKDGKRLGFEFKYSDAPRKTRSMEIALEILELDELTVIYPGTKDYPLSDKITVKSLNL